MNTIYLPKISEADHQTFRSLVHLYPAYPYDEWLDAQAKEIANWEGEGHKVVLVDVSVDDVIRYCGTGARCDIKVLRAIARAKAIGKFN